MSPLRVLQEVMMRTFDVATVGTALGDDEKFRCRY